MKYQVTLNARDAEGIFQEVVLGSTDVLEEAQEAAHNIAKVLHKIDRCYGGPVVFVTDEAGALYAL